MINNEKKWYGRPVYKYKIIICGKLFYSCVSIQDDQDDVVRQLKAKCEGKKFISRIYRNGEFIATIPPKNSLKSHHKMIKDKHTGEIYKNMRDMVNQTGWDNKHCSYLVNRTMRYTYIENDEI